METNHAAVSCNVENINQIAPLSNGVGRAPARMFDIYEFQICAVHLERGNSAAGRIDSQQETAILRQQKRILGSQRINRSATAASPRGSAAKRDQGARCQPSKA